MSLNWWNKKQKKVNVIVDNESWMLPYVQNLVEKLNEQNHFASLIRKYKDIQEADISFYLGCTNITHKDVLQKSKKNLVVHESNLPKGKGFSPLTWQILEGKNKIPICLLEMNEKVDSGPIIFRDMLLFSGHELIDELRERQGKKTIELCLRYIEAPEIPIGKIQKGKESFYKRRTPKDSEIDINVPLKEAFNLLRVVDNEKYPAFFERDGYKYSIKIFKNEAPKLNE